MDTFTAIFEKGDKYWIAYVEELPGANTQGETLDEARENLIEAVRMVIVANREIARRNYGRRNVIRENLRIAI